MKRAFITGGSTGIGRATAIELASQGCDVAITYASDEDDAKQTAQHVEQLGRRCIVKQLDLSTPENAVACVKEVYDELGGLDIVVSNAGMMIHKTMPQLTLENAHTLFNVNVFGALMLIQKAVEFMLPEGLEGQPRSTPGRIIVVTSVHEHVANPGDTLYTMSKHALGGMVKCLALQLSPLNITVNAIAPGEIATPMNNMESEDYDDHKRPAVPVRRIGRPEEVAAAIAFLAGESSGFVTGASWPVDGGFEVMTPLAMTSYREEFVSE